MDNKRGKKKNTKFMQKGFCVCLWKVVEKLKIETYWKISPTFHIKLARNPSLCTTGDGGYTFRHWASPEKFFYRRQQKPCRVSVWTTKAPPPFSDSSPVPNAASLSPSVHYIGCKITVSTAYLVHHVANKAPFETQLLPMKR